MNSPLHQFEIIPLVKITLGGLDISFTNASLFMILAAVLPLLALGIFRGRLTLIPGRFQSVLEMAYTFVAGMLKETNGDKGMAYFPLVFSVFLFVLMGNMLGMIPFFFTFTSHIIVTFALAGFLFLAITAIGLFRQGVGFLAIFCPPGVPLLMTPILVPIEILSYLSRPVSLAVRLFANMMAGHTMLKVFGGFTAALGLWGVGPLAVSVALIGFEVLVSFLQAYVFTILTCIYLHDALYSHHG